MDDDGVEMVLCSVHTQLHLPAYDTLLTNAYRAILRFSPSENSGHINTHPQRMHIIPELIYTVVKNILFCIRDPTDYFFIQIEL